jgi:hypothetical protein
MSFISPAILNLNHSQVLLSNQILTNSTIGTIISLNSIQTTSNKISLLSSPANTIKLETGCDYFITSNIPFLTNSPYYVNSSGTNFLYHYRLGLYDVTNSVWLTQKTTWPNISNNITAFGGHSSALFCVIPSLQNSINIQLRVYSQVTPTATIDATIYMNNASNTYPDSCLNIYHN